MLRWKADAPHTSLLARCRCCCLSLRCAVRHAPHMHTWLLISAVPSRLSMSFSSAAATLGSSMLLVSGHAGSTTWKHAVLLGTGASPESCKLSKLLRESFGRGAGSASPCGSSPEPRDVDARFTLCMRLQGCVTACHAGTRCMHRLPLPSLCTHLITMLQRLRIKLPHEDACVHAYQRSTFSRCATIHVCKTCKRRPVWGRSDCLSAL